MTRGRFISIEGGEGSGKSTQIAALAAAFEARGLSVVRTREPGGSKGAEEIRALLVNGHAERWSPMAELLLVMAARIDHVEKVIEPALAAGQWVISDRFSDSTYAYQGAAGALGAETVRAVQALALGDFAPDLTLILDIPAAEGLARAAGRAGGEGRFEDKGIAYHETIRRAFLEIAAREPGRCKVIGASGDAASVTAAVLAALEPLLTGKAP